MFALVDANAFYVSCEKVFRPGLNGRPVVVLGNNDGCVIARSDEARKLGIKMGAPWFEIRHLEDEAGLVAMSPNFALYADMSDRVMSLVAGLGHRQMVYSIDEAFADLTGIRGDMTLRCRRIRERILKWTGIPCGVGIGSTMTLSKLANFIAKSAERKPGSYPEQHVQVCNLVALPAHEIDQLLARTEVGEIWGVGRRIGAQLQEAGVMTALDLKRLDAAAVKRRWSVVLERTVRELQGTPCIGFEEEVAAKKQIACTRSFGRPVTELSDLQQAVTEFSARVAEKLRRQNSHAGQVLCFIRTSPFRFQDPQYSRSIVVPLRRPSNDNAEIAGAALRGLRFIYRSGYQYAKAGVMLMDIGSADIFQFELPLGSPEDEHNGARGTLMAAIDELNLRYGRGTVQLASAGPQGRAKVWAMRQERMSQGYTTRWDELAVVRA
ncbi:DNA polymerase V subunit UmuC (plasmid) [Acidovorax carolinensis]|uniref:DNA polymerase V subunit UmuC n=1 Tax=Acidovorax carolinensis TaxID=553814 RepID=A0A240UJQ1_9BURK|nr:Y-family DNA polymerase [Acidovorax carolinensis]ART57244.1 DNA polymerase V subunit UmuC [Acidovorax carolinensis]ART61303.1 DNA polymerase V subunit UmuC [Acidovorax carolinensis]